MRQTILTFVAHYLPAYKSGGPVRSIANMVNHLGDDIDFRIVTADRDATDTKPFPHISVDQWNQVGKARVFYLSSTNCNLKGICRLIRSTPHDVLYVNSFFNPKYTMFPLLARRLWRIHEKSTIIAPRGEFSKGALAFKQWKKILYIRVANAIGLYQNLIWQASSEHELEDIKRHMPKAAKNIVVVPNLPHTTPDKMDTSSRKFAKPLQILFLSRITPTKNLSYAIDVLGKVKESVVFNIYGPIRDEAYWKICQSLIKSMPSHVTARYHGPVVPAQVPEIMSAHDLFFLPTHCENYGHVIMEALSAGTPVLIANTTPWRGMNTEEVGWDLDLSNKDAFVKCIDQFATYSSEKYNALRKKVRNFAIRKLSDPSSVKMNRKMFENAAKLEVRS